MMAYWTNIILFRTKSVLMLKKNLIANLSTIKIFWKPTLKSYGDEATDVHNKKSLRWILLAQQQSAWILLWKRKRILPNTSKNKKVIRHIIDDLERSSYDYDGE